MQGHNHNSENLPMEGYNPTSKILTHSDLAVENVLSRIYQRYCNNEKRLINSSLRLPKNELKASLKF